MHTRQVSIEKMVYGGAGFGRLDGKACFVPFTAPGDEVAIVVTREKRSYLEGEVQELLTASPLRAQPPCPIFGSCGGCNWQHLPYGEQLVQKQEIFSEFLFRAGRVGKELVSPIVPSPEPFGYRSRVQFKVRSVAGNVHVGFYRRGSHFAIAVPERCAIAHPAINRFLGRLRSVLAVCPEVGNVPQVDVAVGEDGAVVATFHYIGEKYGDFRASLQDAALFSDEVGGLCIQRGRKDTLEQVRGIDSLSYVIPEEFLPGMPGMRIVFGGGGFSQVNYRQNLAILSLVLRLARLGGTERVLDLFCGNGNFSLPLSGYAAEIVGMEAYEPSIRDAIRNCRVNGVTNARYTCDDAQAGIQRLAARGEKFDVVLLDPPRTGAADVVKLLPAVEPRSIIYVSCDPATLARDIGILQRAGYAVAQSCPVDMFPQTYHIESVTLLERCAGSTPKTGER